MMNFAKANKPGALGVNVQRLVRHSNSLAFSNPISQQAI
jgi:hypothetical protein